MGWTSGEDGSGMYMCRVAGNRAEDFYGTSHISCCEYMCCVFGLNLVTHK